MLIKVYLLPLALALASLVPLPGRSQALPPVDGPGSTLSQAARPSIARSPKLPYGLQLMARFGLLPLLRDTKCVQDSSYDRSGGNGDAGNFLRVEGNTAVLSDIRGPGCIYRFWSANAAGQLHIYFDGETTPRIDCPMQDLFMGKVAPFVQPLVGHRSGGWYCFFPMPFAKSCRIEVTNPGVMYYHVQYQLFPDSTPVQTFRTTLTPTETVALKTILQQWDHLGDAPVAIKENGQKKNISLAAGETRTLMALKGPALIERLKLDIAPADRNTLRQTVLRIYWDGALKPGIEAPVGDFFGSGFGDQHFKALPDAMTGEGYVCYWPMPFIRSARIELSNLSKTDLKEVRWSVDSKPSGKPLADAGYFHAQWHRQTTVEGEYFHILQTAGRGHYVGEHTDMQGDRGIGFLEGDEKIFVDGEKFPSIYGTGTEDFYTGGWYFDEGPFNLAYHGCILKRDDLSRVAAYRYQIQDCVPFQKEIRIDIEHGGVNDYPGADYSCVAYWYQDSPAHDWSPIDPAQLTPAHPKFAGVLEAESLTWSGGPFEVKDDSALAVEASGGKYVALAGGDTTFAAHVDRRDVYLVHIGELMLPDSPNGLTISMSDEPKRLSGIVLKGPTGQSERWDYSFPIRLDQGDHLFTLNTPQGKTRYVDYIRMESAPKEKGVIEAESLTERATVTDGTVKSISDSEGVSKYGEQVIQGLSGMDMLEWSATSKGATLTLPLQAPAEGDYEVELGMAMLSPGSVLEAVIDNGAPVAIDLSGLPTFAPNAEDFRVQRVRVGRFSQVAKEGHTLLLTSRGAPIDFHIDYIRVQKSLYPGAIEAENLKILDAQDGEATHQELGGDGNRWSGDNQFWFLGQKAGAEATLELPVTTTGRYNLSVYYTTARDYGIAQVLLDGKEIGSPTDCYTQGVLPKSKTTLGMVDLTAGFHRITFRAVGKNAVSSGFLLGVDAILLEPVK